MTAWIKALVVVIGAWILVISATYLGYLFVSTASSFEVYAVLIATFFGLCVVTARDLFP